MLAADTAAARLATLRATGKSDAECARILRFEAGGHADAVRDAYCALAAELAPRATTATNAPRATATVRDAGVFNAGAQRINLRKFR